MLETELTKFFSENLQRLMSDRGYTQRELGDKIGVSRTAINNWCLGYSMPRMGKIDKLCGILGVDRSALIGNSCAGINETLTKDERDIIDKYRQLKRKDKAVIQGMVDILFTKGELK